MDWLEFYEYLQTEFDDMANAPEPQFGTESQPYLLARYLPERVRTDVLDLTFEESVMAFRTAPALDNTRYSPVQMGQSGMELADIKVTMGHTDTADQLTARDHDGIIRLLERSLELEASAVAINWADRILLQPHLQKNEIQRAEALLLGTVNRRGINGFIEQVDLAVPVGHRPTVPGGTVATPAGWNDPEYDIMSDVLLGQQVLAANGYAVTDMLATNDLLTIMKRSESLAALRATVTTPTPVILSSTGLNAIFNDYELPGITKYDNGYRYPLANGSAKYRKFMEPTDDYHYFVMLGNTGRDATISGDQDELILSDTLGYYALGRNPAQSNWGRTIYTEVMRKKPSGLYGESYQTGFPVLMNADAVYVIRVGKPA